MRTDAVILRAQPWREQDLLLQCYTEQTGVVGALAKGALKEGSVQGMHLVQGNIVHGELVSGRGMPIMTSAYATSVFPRTRSQRARLAASWVLLECVSTFVSAPERDAGLWQTLTNTLHALETCQDEEVLAVLRNAQRELLGVFGYTPQVANCGVCGAAPPDGNTSFSVELGSVICSRCTGSGWYGAALSDTDRQWLSGVSRTAPCVRRPLRAPTEQLLEYIAGRQLVSLNLLFEAVQK